MIALEALESAPSPLLTDLRRLDALLEQGVEATRETAAMSSSSALPPRSARMCELGTLLGLREFELDVVLLALGCELDSRYERLIAYLHEDAGQRRPTVDLAVTLLCPSTESRLSGLAHFASSAPLRATGALRLDGDSGDAELPLAACALRLDRFAVMWLLGTDESRSWPTPAADGELAHVAPAVRHSLDRANGPRQFVVASSPGEARRVADLVAAESGAAVAAVDAEDATVDPALALMVRLRRAVLYVERGEALDGEHCASRHVLAAAGAGAVATVVHAPSLSGGVLEIVPDAIAVQVDPAAPPEVGVGRQPQLRGLARRVEPRFGWADIVLPRDQLDQLREICSQVRTRDQVLAAGFGRKYHLGRSLPVLFSGPSGTGKSMAAEVVAGDLKLDLYRIDLSRIVDKYIGETEKRLERVFAAAEGSSAILFFDEADALFGKRSETKDAHDRYANVELAYLLQRIELYSGPAILTTNLRANIDDAFIRRLAFAVEFPVPDTAARAEIWQRVWPAEVELEADIDFEFLAETFELAGALIRSIAVNAAHLAAADHERPSMTHLVCATRREYQKLGHSLVDDEFGPYAALLTGRAA